MNRLLIAHTPIGEQWWATSLKGAESLSGLYSFTVELESDKSDIDGQSLIGEVCAVELRTQRNGKRYFSGQIVKASALGKQDRHWMYKIIIAPKLWHASRRADFKIWQSMTVQAITDEVLQQNAIRYEWRLKNSYKTWEYLVQYGETDLDFLCRLFEHEGIYYWFEHGTGGETLILGDHTSTHEPFDGYESIPFGAPFEKDQDCFINCYTSREPEPGRYQHRDYDFKQPSKDMTTEFVDPKGHLFDQYEIYDYPGHYIEPGDGVAYATARLETLQTQQDVIELAGGVRGAVPGCRFALTRHPVGSLNREYMITRAHYEAVNNDYEAAGRGEGARFEVRAEALPSDRQYRSQLKTSKPRTRGPETAVVVGPEGSEIHTDQYGRVKVHFHWDRYGKKDGNDSCWIRVSSPWAGSNYGGIHIPRVGQEVIVDHEYGDPDRPIITGRVYNAQQMPPWGLPANKTQSGFLTRSSLQGTSDNANALRFEDAKGKEQVWLHAERNQDIEVEVDETHWVGQDRKKTIDRDEETTVHRHRTETVDGNETITVHQNRTETVDQNETITIHQNRKKTVDLNETSKIGKNKAETIMLASVQSVGAARMDNVGAAYNLNVGAAQLTNIGAAYSLNVGLAMSTVVGLNQITKVGKNQTTNVGNDITVTAGDSITLEVGKSKLVMKKDGTILLNGKDLSTVMDGKTSIKSDGDINLKGAKINEN